jgi:succinate-acetate transporter protein
MGTPLPLGFLGQGVASWAFACLQLSWIDPAQGHLVALGVLVFTVPLQAVASVLGLLARDPVAGTGMGLLSGGWAILAVATLVSPPGSTSTGLGVLLVGLATAVLVPAAAALSRLAAAAVLVVSVARFAVTGVAELLGSQAWLQAAGWVGLVLAAAGLYAAAAFELEAVMHRTWLPIGRLHEGSADRFQEPGVRPRL